MVRGPKFYCPDFHQIIAERNRRCIDEKEKLWLQIFHVPFCRFPQPIYVEAFP